jgi:hypothetical protein
LIQDVDDGGVDACSHWYFRTQLKLSQSNVIVLIHSSMCMIDVTDIYSIESSETYGVLSLQQQPLHVSWNTVLSFNRQSPQTALSRHETVFVFRETSDVQAFNHLLYVADTVVRLLYCCYVVNVIAFVGVEFDVDDDDLVCCCCCRCCCCGWSFLVVA